MFSRVRAVHVQHLKAVRPASLARTQRALTPLSRSSQNLVHPARFASGSAASKDVETASASVVLNPDHTSSLPAIPDRQSADHAIDEVEFTQNVLPLYTQHWFITYNTVTENGLIHSQPQLSKPFLFKDSDNATSFFREFSDILFKEKFPGHVGLAAKQVFVHTNVGAQLTSGDIHVALLAETLYRKYVAEGNHGIDTHTHHDRPSTLMTVTKPDQPARTESKEAPPAKKVWVRAIPPLPNAPQTPVRLDNWDYSAYLQPLYTRRWTIKYATKSTGSERKVLHYFGKLGKTFHFSEPAAALQFAKFLTETVAKEQTEHSINVLNSAVTFVTYTAFPGVSPFGISQRDVRAAILAETLFTEKFAGKAVEDTSPWTFAQPWTVSHFLKQVRTFKSYLKERRAALKANRTPHKAASKAGEAAVAA